MSQPQQPSQSWYYNTPYPPILLPSIQYPQIPSPTSSQFTSESDSPSPTQNSCLKSQQTPSPNLSSPDPGRYHATQQPFQFQDQPLSSSPYTYTSLNDFPIPAWGEPAPRVSKSRSSKSSTASSKKIQIAHPYARLHAKKGEVKRRKIWNHALEKLIFTPYELSTLGAPQRRSIYISSLEAHVDRLHDNLLALGFWPVRFEDLDPFKGLNSKTAKSMVAGLQYDSSVCKLKLLELERANDDLQKVHSNFSAEL